MTLNWFFGTLCLVVSDRNSWNFCVKEDIMVLIGTAQWGASRGARFLDKKDPGWFTKIDTRILDISDGRACVLGQLYGYYTTGCKKLGIGFGKAMSYGFELLLLGSVNKAWQKEIAARRRNAVLFPG